MVDEGKVSQEDINKLERAAVSAIESKKNEMEAELRKKVEAEIMEKLAKEEAAKQAVVEKETINKTIEELKAKQAAMEEALNKPRPTSKGYVENHPAGPFREESRKADLAPDRVREIEEASAAAFWEATMRKPSV